MNNLNAQDVIVWILIGLVAGWLASVILPGPSLGLFGSLIAGLIGSVVGGFLAGRFGIRLNLGSALVEQIVLSTAGAIIVLIIARIIT